MVVTIRGLPVVRVVVHLQKSDGGGGGVGGH